jgi:hypothetical protein
MTDIRTPGNKAIAKKWGLSSKKVKDLVKRGAKHEQEHDTDMNKAAETARDHIGERPDYYRMLKKAEKMDKDKLTEARTKKQHAYKKGDHVEANLSKGYWSKGQVSGVDKNGTHVDVDIGTMFGSKNTFHIHHNLLRKQTVKEDQINELSNKTLGSYIKKASDSRADAQYRAAEYQNTMNDPKKKSKRYGWKQYGKDLRTVQHRRTGIQKAADKMAKEETINEISSDLAKRYINKATKSIEYNTERRSKAQSGMFPGIKRTDSPHEKNMKSIIANSARKDFNKSDRNVTNRKAGIHRAVDRMEEEQINELTKKTLVSYTRKAAVDKADVEKAMTRRVTYKNTETYNKAKEKQGRRFQNRDTGLRRAEDKLVNPHYGKDSDMTKRAWLSKRTKDRNFKKSGKGWENYREPGRDRQYRTPYGEMEESAIINEIGNTMRGQATLLKYIRGSAKDLHNTGLMMGHDSASNPRPNGGETEVRKTGKRIVKNRTNGIEGAMKRLVPGIKEEQMDIKETSSDKASRYYDAADADLKKRYKKKGKDNLRKMMNRQDGIQRAMTKGAPYDDYIRKTGVNEETTMENENLVAEAINNILEGNLEQMRQNLFDTLQERAMEKLEERKRDIASSYFAQSE